MNQFATSVNGEPVRHTPIKGYPFVCFRRKASSPALANASAPQPTASPFQEDVQQEQKKGRPDAHDEVGQGELGDQVERLASEKEGQEVDGSPGARPLGSGRPLC